MEYVNNKERKELLGELHMALVKEMSPTTMAMMPLLYVSSSSEWNGTVCGMAWTDSRKPPPANPARVIKSQGKKKKNLKSFHYSHSQAKVKKLVQSWWKVRIKLEDTPLTRDRILIIRNGIFFKNFWETLGNPAYLHWQRNITELTEFSTDDLKSFKHNTQQ